MCINCDKQMYKNKRVKQQSEKGKQKQELMHPISLCEYKQLQRNLKTQKRFKRLASVNPTFMLDSVIHVTPPKNATFFKEYHDMEIQTPP